MEWRNIENQIYVDHSRYASADIRFDEDCGTSSEEDESNEEGDNGPCEFTTDNESGTIEDDEPAIIAEQAATDAAIPVTEDRAGRSRNATPSCRPKSEENAVSRFLTVIDDHDTNRASVERLRDFFGDVSLQQLEAGNDGIVGSPMCKTVLDNRNLTSGLYRDYLKPLSAREVYEVLK